MPNTSPGPRSRKSVSASSKPSVEATNALSRSPRFLGLRIAEDAAEARKLTAADPPAKLMELRQAEAMPALDRHQRGVRHVDAHLDHRRGDQHLDFAAAEIGHHGVFFGRRHAAVEQAEPERLQFAVGQLLVGFFQADGLDRFRSLRPAA